VSLGETSAAPPPWQRPRKMVSLATICLNEAEFIGHWLAYHYGSFDRIFICEGADRNYPREAVTADGLSTDWTAATIRAFPDPQHKIRFAQRGWMGREGSSDDRVPAKIALRNVYARQLPEGYAFTLDVDEFLHPFFVRALVAEMDREPEFDAYAIPQLHLWQTPGLFITGGYADVPHARLYRWTAGSSYRLNHNHPSSPDGRLLSDRQKRGELIVGEGELRAPAIVHYGFCENKASAAEKFQYYLNRGEARTRPETMAFRHAALLGVTPPGCSLHRYRGFVPVVPPERGFHER
jgi:hypothetical protein